MKQLLIATILIVVGSILQILSHSIYSLGIQLMLNVMCVLWQRASYRAEMSEKYREWYLRQFD